MKDRSERRWILKGVVLIVALGAMAAIVVCLLQRGKATPGFRQKLDCVVKGDTRETVRANLGAPSAISRHGTWPGKDPQPTNVVYMHIGPAPFEVWRYEIGDEEFTVHFGPEDWITPPDTWRVTHTSVPQKQDGS